MSVSKISIQRDPMDTEVAKGIKTYTKFNLMFYNFLVLKVFNTFVWKCPSKILLSQYQLLIGNVHADIGPGTGWFIHNANPPKKTKLYLIDLNPNCLKIAGNNLKKWDPTPLEANILEPFNVPEKLDSVSINYVLHCLPGPWENKQIVFKHIADNLKDNGVVFGSTLLAPTKNDRLSVRLLAGLFNRKGIFSNQDDTEPKIKESLTKYFSDVEMFKPENSQAVLFIGKNPVRNN